MQSHFISKRYTHVEVMRFGHVSKAAVSLRYCSMFSEYPPIGGVTADENVQRCSHSAGPTDRRSGSGVGTEDWSWGSLLDGEHGAMCQANCRLPR